jgi:hypothetical protein
VRFHVQVSRGFRVACAFNLEEPELRAAILAPWSRGTAITLGEREWDPARCELRILAGPELEPARLAIGQGWQNAERSAREVTAKLLSAPPPLPTAVALLAQTPAAAAAAVAALERLGLEAPAWEPGGAGAAAALIAFDAGAERADARWWLEVGRALGALGERALLAVHGGDALPAPLDGAPALRLDAQAPQALAERLRLVARAR